MLSAKIQLPHTEEPIHVRPELAIELMKLGVIVQVKLGSFKANDLDAFSAAMRRYAI